MLVLPDEHREAALELCQLQQPEETSGSEGTVDADEQQQQQEERRRRIPPSQAADVVGLVATVLRYIHLHQRSKAELAMGAAAADAAVFEEAYPPPALARVAALARHLVVLAVRAKWPALTALLLPAVTADGSSAAEAALDINGICAPASSIADVALATGSMATLSALLLWASQHQVDMQATAGAEAAPCKLSLGAARRLDLVPAKSADLDSGAAAVSDGDANDPTPTSTAAAIERSLWRPWALLPAANDTVHKFERAYALLLCLGQVVLWARTAHASATDHMHQALLVAISLLFLMATTLLPAASYRWHRAYLIPLLRVAAHTLGSQRTTTVSAARCLSELTAFTPPCSDALPHSACPTRPSTHPSLLPILCRPPLRGCCCATSRPPAWLACCAMGCVCCKAPAS